MMFEKLWKPYFDVWTRGMGDLLEKYFRSPSTLRGISNALNTTFRGKKVTDKALYVFLTTAGLPSYRDQKRLLHVVTRLGAQLEDLEEKIDQMSLPQDQAQRQYEALDARLGLLFQRVEEIAQAQQSIHQKLDQVSEPAALPEPRGLSDEHKALASQLTQLDSRLDALLSAELVALQQLPAPQADVDLPAAEARSQKPSEPQEAQEPPTTATKKAPAQKAPAKKKAATKTKKTTKKAARKTTKKK